MGHQEHEQHLGDSDLLAVLGYENVFIEEGFIEQSKDSYPLQWCLREIAQNFLDHGKKGTLDDVRVDVQESEGEYEIRVEGDWAFKDKTGVLALSGDKDADSAGGNQIGLKQVLVRMCRDFGVSNFLIEGDGWDVDYSLKSAENLNAELQAIGQTNEFSKGWMIPVVTRNEARPSKNAYVIKTKNKALAKAFKSLKDLGVHSANPYLQQPDFESDLGLIKWGQEVDTPGRLFVKGQVTHFNKKPENDDGTTNSFWGSLPGVSVSLPVATRYEKSVDRPPLDRWALSRLLREVVEPMGKPGILAQLKASKHLWQQWGMVEKDASFMVVVSALLAGLDTYGDNQVIEEERTDLLGPGEHYYVERGTPAGQIKILVDKGATVYPADFRSLGLESVSQQFDELDNAYAEAIDPAKIRQRQAWNAQREGIAVNYRVLEKLDGELTTLFKPVFGKMFERAEQTDKGVRLHFTEAVETDRFSEPFLPDGDLIAQCRNFIASLMLGGVCGKALLRQSGVSAVFTIADNEASGGKDLFSRIGESSEVSENLTLDLELEGNTITAKDIEEAGKGKVSGTALGVSMGALAIVGALITYAVWPDSEDKKATHSKGPGISDLASQSDLENEFRRWQQKRQNIVGGNTIKLPNTELRDDIRARAPKPFYTDTLPLQEGADLRSHDRVKNFKIVDELTRQESARLNLLITYFEERTRLSLANMRFFAFTGEGARGINIRRYNIGIWRSLLNQSNGYDALKTFVHEMAHVGEMSHNADFESIMASLNIDLLEAAETIEFADKDSFDKLWDRL